MNTYYKSSDTDLEEKDTGRQKIWLILAAVITVVLWRVPFGNFILYPFTLLATWFHEMGHGLTALALGGNFKQLVIYSNGSGVAMYGGALFLERIGRALVAAGGPMGPPIAGAIFIISGKNYKTAHFGLIFLGCFLMISGLIWVRSIVGLALVMAMGICIIGIAMKTNPLFQEFTLQFLGVQACISTYYQIDYLFSHSALVGGRQMLSDTGQMADNLFLPYWFWGGVMSAASILLLLISLQIAYRKK